MYDYDECASLEDMEYAIKSFIDDYEGTAIGESIKRQYENRQDLHSIYEQIEDFGY